MTPQRFERFSITRKLPAGGMGRVYEAIDTSNGRRVALKMIDRGTDADTLQVLAAERLGVELHKRLYALDPRITAVYDTGETSEYLYIVMEYVDGQDLSELAAIERIGYPFAARIAQDVLEVLSIAHDFGTVINGHEYRGIVHGDIKPRNIRLTTVGQVKVLDFGIAKALSLTRSFTQNVFGSVQYSSPERLNTGEVTISSDLWSVAVVLFEMVARHPYFQSDSGPKLERLIRNYDAMSPLPEECPETLKQILERALAPNSAYRYQTAAAFAADLRAFRENRELAPVAFDGEATRRTVRNSEMEGETRQTAGTNDATTATMESEATRRTSPGSNGRPLIPEVVSTPRSPARPIGVKAARRAGPRWGRIALLVFLIFGALIGYFVVSEYVTWQDARALARDLDSERVQVEPAWDRYQKLANGAHFSLSLWSAQDALRNRLLADANRVINQYRDADAPVIMEGDWVRARTEAARALELYPHDKTVRGTLRIIDGQINRIRGTARRNAQMLQQSRENFEEAAQLIPKSPDPWLGLARLYVYSLHDVDAAENALKRAEHNGHNIGKRETAQLGDGYRDRGERTMREAENAVSNTEEKRYLELAQKDLEHARKLYESIIPWGGAASNLHRTYEDLQRVDGLKHSPELH
jgi:serine/threonine protein kinase